MPFGFFARKCFVENLLDDSQFLYLIGSLDNTAADQCIMDTTWLDLHMSNSLQTAPYWTSNVYGLTFDTFKFGLSDLMAITCEFELCLKTSCADVADQSSCDAPVPATPPATTREATTTETTTPGATTPAPTTIPACLPIGGAALAEALAAMPDAYITGSFVSNGRTYSVSGSILGEIIQLDLTDESTYNLGLYSRMENTSSMYTNGDFCGAISADRTSEIQWECGELDFEIYEASEPSTCNYLLKGEVRCCDFAPPTTATTTPTTIGKLPFSRSFISLIFVKHF